MDFTLSDEQRGLVETTRALLNSKDPVGAARALIETTGGYDEGLWRSGAELGWPALALPEEDGGLGQQLVDLVLVAIEHGRSLATVPFVPTVVVADAVARSASPERAKILEALTSGTATAAWAFAEFGRPWAAQPMQVRAEEVADGYRISGTKVAVQDADSAGWLLVDVSTDGQPARLVIAADTPGVHVTPQSSLDVSRSYCDVSFDGAFVGNEALIAAGPGAANGIAASNQMITVLTCAELTGIGEGLLEMTVGYVGQRMQFGRPVGSYQAVKHKCADIRIWTQATAAATYYAAMAVDASLADRAHAVSVAKAYASEAANRIAGEALQLHGGIGFTWEHDLHLYLRRSRTLSLLYGDAAEHREMLCAALEQQETQADA